MKVLLISLGIILLTGCVSEKQRNAQQEQMNKTVPTCASQKQCDAAWSAARQWVTQNCGMKIQNYSADYIETYNSLPNSPSTACQVTKNLQPSGVNTLNITVSCGNIFGCVPNQVDSVLAFNKFVGDYVSNFSPVKIGAFMGMSDKSGNVVENSSYSAGMVIKEVVRGGIADKSGLRNGDIITSVGGHKIRNQSDMTTSLEKYTSGETVDLTIIRSGSEFKIPLSL
ncbi:PDZ domain-containing protein [Cronobacter malonaticus]|uniref:PDZ domain-containing protein n=1 Tax=Cronobacter TaxID=413496 RepID=UPI0009D787B7|nr:MULTISPECIES: PDZ domain-containing protein [Cronobacter]EGT5705066.1 PDZ domain-containing protein [Cronobacter sakazakii]EJG0831713.1 PDZ domain-containing protein [Cronobacter sakazakii]EKK5245545.1 PDZ domain-containing protein [Cronobacter sakazakii]ELQ6012525.1 PDZ domain-containing protein [Cronobacter sakazakii]ELY4432068.1 PDZ domain-containing protein [Cronobacter sakazakii]